MNRESGRGLFSGNVICLGPLEKEKIKNAIHDFWFPG
jgi:hypothetical protein